MSSSPDPRTDEEDFADVVGYLEARKPLPSVGMQRRVRHRIAAAYARQSLRHRATALLAAGLTTFGVAIAYALLTPLG